MQVRKTERKVNKILEEFNEKTHVAIDHIDIKYVESGGVGEGMKKVPYSKISLKADIVNVYYKSD